MDRKKNPGERLTSDALYEAIWMDVIPTPAVLNDFGIASYEHYKAVYYAVRNGRIQSHRLEEVLGDGPKITEMVNGVEGCNPKGLTFHTDWDVIYGRETLEEVDKRNEASRSAPRRNRRENEHER